MGPNIAIAQSLHFISFITALSPRESANSETLPMNSLQSQKPTFPPQSWACQADVGSRGLGKRLAKGSGPEPPSRVDQWIEESEGERMCSTPEPPQGKRGVTPWNKKNYSILGCGVSFVIFNNYGHGCLLKKIGYPKTQVGRGKEMHTLLLPTHLGNLQMETLKRKKRIITN